MLPGLAARKEGYGGMNKRADVPLVVWCSLSSCLSFTGAITSTVSGHEGGVI